MGYVVRYIYIVYIYGNKVRVCVQPVNGTPRVPLTCNRRGQRHPEGTVDPRPDHVPPTVVYRGVIGTSHRTHTLNHNTLSHVSNTIGAHTKLT